MHSESACEVSARTAGLRVFFFFFPFFFLPFPFPFPFIFPSFPLCLFCFFRLYCKSTGGGINILGGGNQSTLAITDDQNLVLFVRYT